MDILSVQLHHLLTEVKALADVPESSVAPWRHLLTGTQFVGGQRLNTQCQE